MKKILLLTFLLSIYAGGVFSQSNTQLVCLDNYSIPKNKKGVTIGKVVCPSNLSVKLASDSSGLFVLDKKGNLRLKKNKEITDQSPMTYIVNIQYGQFTKTFELVKDDFIHNKVIAHRGAWKNNDASQNSLKALKKAIEIGCEGSEFDVWLSQDNVAVLSHDPEIGGKKVEETDAAELFQIALKDGDFLPSLEQYINQIKTQNKSRLILEVKSSLKGKGRSEAVADSCVQIVHRLNAQAWVSYITFNYAAAMRIRELDSTAEIQVLQPSKALEEFVPDKISGIDFHYSHFQKDEELAARAKSLGLKTNVWTVNKEEDMRAMLDQGVDFITTDEPELLIRVLSDK